MDPCLCFKKNNKGMCFIAIYVDDNLLVGNREAIKETIKDLKANGLILKIEDDLKDYLSCEVKFLKDMKKAWLGQPHLINNLEAKFGDRVQDMR